MPKPLIRGMHGMFYSSQADQLRAFLRDKLGLPATDVGQGWLIMEMPKADLGVHPNEDNVPPSGTAHISFYCEDIEYTVRELKARGVTFSKEIQDQGWGLVAGMRVPGGFDVDVYQPRYSKE